MLPRDWQPLPLLIPIDDRPGESLLSLLVRAAEANVMGRLAKLLSLASIENIRLEHLPFTQIDAATSIATLVGVSPTGVRRRFHKAVSRDQELVDWYGTNLPRRWISKNIRFAPHGLKQLGHHKDEWSIKPLNFDGDSGEILHDVCHACGERALWQVLRNVASCPRCKTDFSDCKPSYLRTDLLQRATEIARLVSHRHGDREASLRTLPKPFRNWPAGEVLQAIVEFGLIVCSPIAPPGCNRMKLVRGGDFSSYTTEELVAGYDFVKSWPASFDDLICKIADGRPIAAWKALGRFAKYAPSSAPQNALSKLIKGRIEHLRSRSKPTAASRRERNLLTASEASDELKIDKPILRRLTSESECIVIQPGGAKLFQRDRLEAAIVAWRSAKTDSEVALALGVPQPFIRYIADAGLIKPLSQTDAVRLAGDQARYDADSVAKLILTTERRLKPTGIYSKSVGLLDAMTGVLSPNSWIAVIHGICDGSVEAYRRDNAASALDLHVCEDDLAHVRTGPLSDDIPDLAVSYLVAEKLTGIDDIVIGGAVKSGLIDGRKVKGHVRVPLMELARFRTEYALAKEGARCLGIAPVYFAEEMRSRGYKPAGNAHHCIVWRKADVERAVAESRN